jgi:hypothetical protein
MRPHITLAALPVVVAAFAAGVVVGRRGPPVGSHIAIVEYPTGFRRAWGPMGYPEAERVAGGVEGAVRSGVLRLEEVDRDAP